MGRKPVKKAAKAKKPATAAKDKGGRPTSYNEALGDKIVEKLSEGRSLRSICSVKGMPDHRTVIRWQHNDEAFATRCARAREEQAEAEHEEMVDIEDRVLAGKLDPRAANVVLTNKRWRMEKLKAKVFGARIAVDHGVQDDLAEKLAAARERAGIR